MIGNIAFASIGLFNWLVNFFAFYPQSGNQIEPHLVDPMIQEVFFDSLDGVKLQAFFVPRPKFDRVVLFLHGNAGNASHRLRDAVQLANLGTNVLLLSYRGYGKSEGLPSEEGVYIDGRSALQYIQSTLGFSLGRTVILGRSIGSAIAIDIGQNIPVGGLILVSPFSSGRDLASALGISWIAWLTGEPFHSIRKVEQVLAPALFIHGEKDEIVPLSLGRRLFERYSKEKEWKSFPGAGHNDLIQHAGVSYWETIQKFLDRVNPLKL